MASLLNEEIQLFFLPTSSAFSWELHILSNFLKQFFLKTLHFCNIFSNLQFDVNFRSYRTSSRIHTSSSFQLTIFQKPFSLSCNIYKPHLLLEHFSWNICFLSVNICQQKYSLLIVQAQSKNKAENYIILCKQNKSKAYVRIFCFK